MNHSHIDTVRVLNIEREASTIEEFDLVNENNINKESYVISDVDHELLILISFKDVIDLKSIRIHSFTQLDDDDASQPKQVHVYKTDNLNINFEDLSSMKADKTIICKTKKLKKGQIIHLQKSSKNAVKFTKTKHLAIYIDSNQNDTEATLINAITFKVATIAKKALSSTNKAHSLLQSTTAILQETDNEISSYSAHKCVSIKNGTRCEHVDKVLQSLSFYQSLDIQNNESHRNDLMMKFNEEYRTFLDDYIHMIVNHNHEIEDIYNIIVSMPNMNKCTLSKCVLAMRHHRDRAKTSNINDVGLEQEVIFWRDTMDACHCYLYHLYDFGLRIKMDDCKIQNDEEEDFKSHFDAHFAAICNKMKLIKTKLNKLKQFAFTRYESNKFALKADGFVELTDNTFMDGLYEYLCKYISVERMTRIQQMLGAEEYDSESITMDMEADDESNIQQWFDDNHYLVHSISDVYKSYIHDIKLSDVCFKIGHKLRYWRTYEGTEFYIKPKYNSLKEEIQNNNIHTLTFEQFHSSLQRAQQFIHTSQAKNITAFRYFPDSYTQRNGMNITKSASLSLDHVLSVILYTDWSVLSKEFSATFRSRDHFETLVSVKNRNREFAIWSRILYETILVFGSCGDPTNDNTVRAELWKDLPTEKGPFYCGLSSVVVIPAFHIELFAPTSTTKQIEVAQRFASDNGIILQLNNTGYEDACMVTCWNCSWVSIFGGEDERLWMGVSENRGKIRVETVRMMETAQNYHLYFKSLFYFDLMMAGSYFSSTAQDPTHKDYLILYDLTMHAYKYPKYIQKTFEAYVKNKQKIVIKLAHLEYRFGNLYGLIINDLITREEREKARVEFKFDGHSSTNLLKPEVIQLFENVTKIEIHTAYFVDGHVVEYEMDILSLLFLLDKAKSK